MKVIMQPVSKFAILNAFANGTPCPEIDAKVINKVEREDGSNKNYNLSIITNAGLTLTVFVKTI
jgi:hypothetical protein